MVTVRKHFLTELEMLGAGFLQRWRAYGASENSPVIYGWFKRHTKIQSPGGKAGNMVAVRKDLSSLTGLEMWRTKAMSIRWMMSAGIS